MARKKIQYPATSKTLFVAAAITLPFSAFSQPLPSKQTAHLQQSVVNTPVASAQASSVAAAVFSQFSQPQRAAFFNSAWSGTPIQLAPAAATFSQFSQPQFSKTTLPDEQPSALFEVLPPQPVPVVSFAQFSQPQFNKTVLPDEQPSSLFEVLAPSPPPYSGFVQFSQPQPIRATLPDEQPSSLFEVLAPQPPPYCGFVQFSQPQFNRFTLSDEQPSALFEVLPPQPAPFVKFTQFSQPQLGRTTLPDEQPSSLFEVLAPPAPPFVGFSKFPEFIAIKARFAPTEFRSFFLVQPARDTHDGVFVKRKRDRHDRFKKEQDERAKRRGAIYDALHGPADPLPRLEPLAGFLLPYRATPNVGALASVISVLEAKQRQIAMKQQDQDDEEELAMILKDL